MTQYQKALLVMDYLQGLNTDMIAVGRAISDPNLEKSYQLIKENPKITKEEFLRIMGIEEYD